jgi:hypothetical protein
MGDFIWEGCWKKRLCSYVQYRPKIYVPLLRKPLRSFRLTVIIKGKFAVRTMWIACGKVGNGKSEKSQSLICEFRTAGNNSPDFCWEVTVCNLTDMNPRCGAGWTFRYQLKAKVCSFCSYRALLKVVEITNTMHWFVPLLYSIYFLLHVLSVDSRNAT